MCRDQCASLRTRWNATDALKPRWPAASSIRRWPGTAASSQVRPANCAPGPSGPHRGSAAWVRRRACPRIRAPPPAAPPRRACGLYTRLGRGADSASGEVGTRAKPTLETSKDMRSAWYLGWQTTWRRHAVPTHGWAGLKSGWRGASGVLPIGPATVRCSPESRRRQRHVEPAQRRTASEATHATAPRETR